MATSKNVGDQIRDAIEDAVQAQDFSKLKSTVEGSLTVAADLVAQGLHQAAQMAQDKTAQHASLQAQAFQQEQQRISQHQQRALEKARFEGVSGKKAVGFFMAVLGGAAAILSAVFVCAFAPLALAATSVGFGITAGCFAALALAGAGLCAAGVKRIALLDRFRAYRGILAARPMCSLEELAAQTGRSVKAVAKDARKMIDKGLFKQGHLDDAQTQLMVSDDIYTQYRANLAAAQERDRQRLLAQSAPTLPPLGAHLEGEPRAILRKGEAYVAQIRASNAAIPGAEITAKIDQIEAVVLSIFKRAEEHPEVIGELDRLMDYYLPTTVKLLDAYENLDKQPIQGETIAKSKAEIEATLDTLNVAFAKLLDSIFTDVAWDVSTDVSVLHTVLAQEGLLEDPFAAKRNTVREV